MELLIEKLSFPRAYRQTRLDLAQWVIENPEIFPDLLSICFDEKNKISHKAAWILEFVCTEKIEMLIPHLDLFFYYIPKAQKDQSVRPFSKICLMLSKLTYKKKDVFVSNFLTQQHKEAMIACCFDWLITEQKVACQAYAMNTLFLLGTEIAWVHPELEIILEQNINSKTAAYKSRGIITLKEIEKYRLKTLKA